MKEKFLKSIQELKKDSPKRNFKQGVDVIINLSGIDLRKTPINVFFQLPNSFKESKICAFLERKSTIIDTVTKEEIGHLDNKVIKKLSKDYDFFISTASLMGVVASNLGKTLGPLEKMPNPKFGGVILKDDDETIKGAIDKFRNSSGIKAKEPSIKFSIGKEDMTDDKLAENANKVYNSIVTVLPNKKENVKSVMVKLTMSKIKKLKL